MTFWTSLPKRTVKRRRKSNSCRRKSIVWFKRRTGRSTRKNIGIFRTCLANLTGKELDIFNLYLDGKTSKQIQEICAITSNTLKYHNANIYSKLGIKSRKELLAYAMMMKERRTTGCVPLTARGAPPPIKAGLSH